jgi:arabinogalactan endo-1,4-beta-galactosidase
VTTAVYFGRDAGWSPTGRVLGADLSFVPQLLSLGAEYRVDGVPADPLDLFADHGFGLVRLRLWHTPDEPWHGLDATLAYASEVRAAGYDLMLDLHYSDTWADPGHQTKPAAWEDLDFPTLVDSVYAYTNAVVMRFRDAGALPQYVQIGNEISGGLLWNEGRVGGSWDTPEQWSQLTALLAAGVAAVRDSLGPSEQPKVVIHVDNGASNALCRWFFDHLEDADLDYDVIGVSFYPWWHGTLTELRQNLHDIAPRYGKEVMVVETSYPWTLDDFDGFGNFVTDPGQLHPGYPATPEGQTSFLRDLQAIAESLPGGLGSGPVYWEPAWIAVAGGSANPHENLTLFDFDGDALPGLGFSLPWQSGVPGGEGHGSRPLLSPAGPNPFASDTSFCLTVPDGGAPVAVRVYDVAGRLVTTLSDGHLAGGRHRLRWSGRDGSGRAVSAGVYLVAAEVGQARTHAKLLVLR